MDYLKEATVKYLAYCREEKRLAPESIRVYTYDLQGFFDHAVKMLEKKQVEVSKVDKHLVQTYIADLNAKWKVKTVKRKIACLRGFFSFLEEDGYIEENPFNKLKIRIKEPVTMPNTMNLTEIQDILRAVYECDEAAVIGMNESLLEFMHLRDIAVLELLFATGLRVHELCELTFNTYDIKNNIIRVIGKGEKERHLYIGNKEVIDAVNNYLSFIKKISFKSDYIFLNRWGRPLSSQAVRNIVTKYCDMAGISRNITPHAFRHTFASLLLEEGVDIKYIQEFLGHSSINTTQIYLHTSEKKKKEIMIEMHPRRKIAQKNTMQMEIRSSL